MTMLKKKLLTPLLMLSMVLVVVVSIEDSHARPTISHKEQAMLQRILFELNASNELLQEAQRNADKQDRFRFSYRCLITDINLIKKGLHTAINGTQNRAFQNQELCIEYGFSGQFGNESALLQQYIQELQSVLPIIRESSLNANKGYRARFNYQVLSSDIETIVSGIERALIGSGEQLRTFPALRGKYSQ